MNTNTKLSITRLDSFSIHNAKWWNLKWIILLCNYDESSLISTFYFIDGCCRSFNLLEKWCGTQFTISIRPQFSVKFIRNEERITENTFLTKTKKKKKKKTDRHKIDHSTCATIGDGLSFIYTPLYWLIEWAPFSSSSSSLEPFRFDCNVYFILFLPIYKSIIKCWIDSNHRFNINT